MTLLDHVRAVLDRRATACLEDEALRWRAAENYDTEDEYDDSPSRLRNQRRNRAHLAGPADRPAFYLGTSHISAGASHFDSVQGFSANFKGTEVAEGKEVSNPRGQSRRYTLRPLEPGVTTLVIRNIPARYNQEALLVELPQDGSFDIFHLPMNVTERRPLGYAFINFKTHELALEFQAKMHGRLLSQNGPTKYLDVTAAKVQGREANLRNVHTRTFLRAPYVELLPVLYENNVRLSIPEVMCVLGLFWHMWRLKTFADDIPTVPQPIMNTERPRSPLMASDYRRSDLAGFAQFTQNQAELCFGATAAYYGGR